MKMQEEVGISNIEITDPSIKEFEKMSITPCLQKQRP